MNDTIKQLIDRYEEKGDFNYAHVTQEMITESENQLKVTLPDQYKYFLLNYGHGGIGGIETLGVGLTGKLIFVNVTEEYRNEDLPDNLVVIENDDEWLYCIDCNTEKIVSWDMDGNIVEEYDCFDDYLLDQMNDAIENL